MQNDSNVTALKAALAKGLVKLSFRKIDGSVREGSFTTNPELIAKDGWVAKKLTADAKPRAASPALVVMYECGKGWRSARVDSIISWTAT